MDSRPITIAPPYLNENKIVVTIYLLQKSVHIYHVYIKLLNPVKNIMNMISYTVLEP